MTDKKLKPILDITQGSHSPILHWHHPDTTAAITVEKLDQLIQLLADRRSYFLPPHQLPTAKPKKHSGVHNPQFWVQDNVLNDGVILHLLHPGFGSLAFPMTQEYALQIASRLARLT